MTAVMAALRADEVVGSTARYGAGFGKLYLLWLIRNSCRDWFQPYGEELPLERMEEWWAYYAPRGEVRAWLFDNRDAIVGMGYLRREDDGRWDATVGLFTWARGRGYGTAMLRFLAEQCADDLWADVRKDNAASRGALRKAGFVPVEPFPDQPAHLDRFVFRKAGAS